MSNLTALKPDSNKYVKWQKKKSVINELHLQI